MNRHVYRGPAVITRQEYSGTATRLRAWALALMGLGVLCCFVMGFVVPHVWRETGARAELVTAAVVLMGSAVAFAGLLICTGDRS